MDAEATIADLEARLAASEAARVAAERETELRRREAVELRETLSLKAGQVRDLTARAEAAETERASLLSRIEAMREQAEADEINLDAARARAEKGEAALAEARNGALREVAEWHMQQCRRLNGEADRADLDGRHDHARRLEAKADDHKRHSKDILALITTAPGDEI